ncbi:MAG: hypothetical protein NVS4B5_02500 [Vulcanimicrobiaceae bacterium]
MRPHTDSRVFDLAIIVAALGVAFVRPSPAWIEDRYSSGVYTTIDRVVRAVTEQVPFCVGDALLVVAVLWWLRYATVSLLRDGRRGTRWRAVAGLASRTLAIGCVLFIWFEVSWAYNYARVPLGAKLVVHDARTDEDSVAAFADRVTDRLSQTAAAAHREAATSSDVVGRLRPAFDATVARLGSRGTFAPPRVKPTIFQPVMALSGSTGFTDPWTHEVNLDATASPYERPAIYAHEWAHVAGFADESDANFISVVACTTSHDPLAVYSGWILVWFNLPSDARIAHRMSRLAYDDIMAIRARFVAHVNPQVERAQRVAYDGYLKSNHVKAGYGSYRLFVRWMTGADFDANGLPKVRDGTALPRERDGPHTALSVRSDTKVAASGGR